MQIDHVMAFRGPIGHKAVMMRLQLRASRGRSGLGVDGLKKMFKVRGTPA